MPQLKRNNHFVPQLYLRNWGDKKKHVWAYPLLVPNKRVANWKRMAISVVAAQRDLYTVISKGQEDDSFERWIDSEFEFPVQESLSKVANDKKLTSSDWNRLALFLAAQDVRTPSNYFETMERWEKDLPDLLEKTLKQAVGALDKNYREGTPSSEKPTGVDIFEDLVKVEIVPKAKSESGSNEIYAGVIAGRKLWLNGARFLLTKTCKVLLNHKWSIVEAAKGMTWFTSDHPVLRLNYYKEGKYDLRGGWGNKGGNIMMPLSPRHLLFTQVGHEFSDYFTFTTEKTYEIQRFLAERAFRYIFANKQTPGVARLRPRHVNLEEFNNEEFQWKKWHEEQSAVEK